MSVWTIVVAAGGGSRFGSAKQFEQLRARRVLDWSLQAAAPVSDGVVVVVPPGVAVSVPGPAVVVPGGATRAQSVRAGLAAVPDTAEVVVVHDAARPLAGRALFAAVIDAVRGGADAAVPGVPVSDTVKRVAGGLVVETLDREALVAVQTPQAFAASVLRAAHAGEPEATDDAALVEALGRSVRVVAGSSRNIKLTNPHDLAVAAVLADDAP